MTSQDHLLCIESASKKYILKIKPLRKEATMSVISGILAALSFLFLFLSDIVSHVGG